MLVTELGLCTGEELIIVLGLLLLRRSKKGGFTDFEHLRGFVICRLCVVGVLMMVCFLIQIPHC